MDTDILTTISDDIIGLIFSDRYLLIALFICKKFNIFIEKKMGPPCNKRLLQLLEKVLCPDICYNYKTITFCVDNFWLGDQIYFNDGCTDNVMFNKILNNFNNINIKKYLTYYPVHGRAKINGRQQYYNKLFSLAVEHNCYYLLAYFSSHFDKQHRFNFKVCSDLALKDDALFLKWAIMCGYQLDGATMSNAAISGNLEILEWCYTNLKSTNKIHKKYLFGVMIFINSIQYGHLNIAQWYINKGFPITSKMCEYQMQIYGIKVKNNIIYKEII